MGIQQLLPFLSKCTENVNIADFEGWTVAVDAYCWLHKGTYACSEELLLGTPTDKYTQYCMKFVQMLIRYKIKPVLVFDGQKLEAKFETEQKRQERRRSAAITARRLLLDGNRTEAKKYLGQAISVTPKMAHDVIDACHKIGVDCIVAQYEADAQLAYLSLSGVVNLVISEDSDLLVFGCRRVLFKLDLSGRGELIEQDRLGEVFGADFSFEKFRYMCMLSGCDYLEGVDGVGLGKALRVFRRAKQSDIRRILANLSGYLGRAVTLKPGYIDSFVKANNTFLHQLVFDPVQRCVRPLNPWPKSCSANDFPCAGRQLEAKVALNLALGNLDPANLKPFENFPVFNPDTVNARSIWSPVYQLPKTPPRRNGVRVSKTVISTSTTNAVLASWGSASSATLATNVTSSKTTVVVADACRKRKTSVEQESRSTVVFEAGANETLSKVRKVVDGNAENDSDAIVIDESESEIEISSNDVEAPFSVLSPSPPIISQTSRFIRRSACSISSSSTSLVPSSETLAGKTSKATDFLGLITPPSTQRSHEEALTGSSPYFTQGFVLPTKLAVGDSENQKTPGSVDDNTTTNFGLASRLAARRMHAQRSVEPSDNTKFGGILNAVNEIVIPEDNTTNVRKEEPKNSIVDNASQQVQNVFLLGSKISDRRQKTTETTHQPQQKNLAKVAANKVQSLVPRGGAVRLLLEKFAFKPVSDG